MSALVQELPRARAPKCSACDAPVDVVNYYGHIGGNSWAALDCALHRPKPWMGLHVTQYDRYEPILLATVGDELWISLECWTRQLGEQVRIMAEAVRR